MVGLAASRVRREAEAEADACAEPNLAVYERDGVEKRVAVPEGMADVVEAKLVDGDFEGLDNLEEVQE